MDPAAHAAPVHPDVPARFGNTYQHKGHHDPAFVERGGPERKGGGNNVQPPAANRPHKLQVGRRMQNICVLQSKTKTNTKKMRLD